MQVPGVVLNNKMLSLVTRVMYKKFCNDRYLRNLHESSLILFTQTHCINMGGYLVNFETLEEAIQMTDILKRMNAGMRKNMMPYKFINRL